MGERTHVGSGAKRTDIVEVEPSRWQEEVGVKHPVAHDLADEREPVGVNPRGGITDDDVTVLDARPVHEAIPVDDTYRGAAEIDLVLAVDAGKLRRLSAEDRASGNATDIGSALDQLCDLLDVDRVGGDVVEEEERLRSCREHVVDAVGGEVGAAPAEPVAPAAQHELRSDGVRRGGEQTLVVDREEAGEGPEGTGNSGRRGRGDGSSQSIDDRVGGGERHAGTRVRRLRGCHGSSLEDMIRHLSGGRSSRPLNHRTANEVTATTTSPPARKRNALRTTELLDQRPDEEVAGRALLHMRSRSRARAPFHGVGRASAPGGPRCRSG